MKRNKTILRLFLTGACLLPVLLFAAKTLPAGYTTPNTRTHIEIDGINFGDFDRIEGLDRFSPDTGKPVHEEASYVKITLGRDFVTDPSLYLWAKNRMSKKSKLKNIDLITKDENGNIIRRRKLELCQPLSWTVEATNPSLGGFNETIDLAVQKTSVF